jgi:hypothetical protein
VENLMLTRPWSFPIVDYLAVQERDCEKRGIESKMENYERALLETSRKCLYRKSMPKRKSKNTKNTEKKSKMSLFLIFLMFLGVIFEISGNF